MVVEWAALHREELAANWARAEQGRPLKPIPPLEQTVSRGTSMLIRIADVQVLDGYRVRLTLTDGRVGEIDLDPLLHGPVFQEIRRDPVEFRRVAVIPEAGTIAWPNGADLCPDVLIASLACA